MLQAEGGGDDPHGEADHQEARRASEGPAVPWMDVWLQEKIQHQPSPGENWFSSGDFQNRRVTWITARGDCEKYQRGTPNRLSRAAFVS